MPGLFDKICRDIDEKCHVPVVFIDGSYKDYESIYTRDEIPFMQLTEHLIEVHGCRKILFLSGPLETATTRERLAGYKRALEKQSMIRTLSALTEASGMIKRQRWQIISSMADVKSLTLSFAVEIIWL